MVAIATLSALAHPPQKTAKKKAPRPRPPRPCTSRLLVHTRFELVGSRSRGSEMPEQTGVVNRCVWCRLATPPSRTHTAPITRYARPPQRRESWAPCPNKKNDTDRKSRRVAKRRRQVRNRQTDAPPPREHKGALQPGLLACGPAKAHWGSGGNGGRLQNDFHKSAKEIRTPDLQR